MPSTTLPSIPVLTGASNFRDLGGLSGINGRRIRTGQVFRSDHLAGLTASDHKALLLLGITHSIDFRGEAERSALPSVLPGATAISLAIEPTMVVSVQAMLANDQVPTQAETVELMCRTYRGLARHSAPIYKRFFNHLLTHSTPLVFHCTAGKDRTGFAAALLLSALGVSREEVMNNYLLTNQLYRRSALVEAPGPAHVMDVLWQVQPTFLDAAFETIDTKFGGLQQYLEGPLGMGQSELERLRHRLLDA